MGVHRYFVIDFIAGYDILFSLSKELDGKEPLVIGTQAVLLSSFLFEYTLQTQIGCNLYVFFTSMSWAYMRRD